MGSHLLSPRLRTVITAYLVVMLAAPVMPAAGLAWHGCEHGCVCPHHAAGARSGAGDATNTLAGSHEAPSAHENHGQAASDDDHHQQLSHAPAGTCNMWSQAVDGFSDCGICYCPAGSDADAGARVSVASLDAQSDYSTERFTHGLCRPTDASPPTSDMVFSLLKPPRFVQ